MVEHPDSQDQVFRALADATRRAMIEQLSHGDASVSKLAEPFDISLAAASKHVGILEESGLIVRTKQGRSRICSLQPQRLAAARDWVQRYAAFWDQRLDALDAALKEDR